MSGGEDGCCSTSPPPSPLHLLEVTVISAQDLHRRRFGRRTRAYAVAWADHGQAHHRLRTDVDRAGGAAPTWNDRFLFRVDDAFLRSETAAVTVEVRGQAPRVIGGGADPVLGRTRIVVSTFLSPFPCHGSRRQVVAALMLRRPRSLRPQGIINVAVSLLDDAHVPLHDAPDAFALKDLVTMTQRAPRSSSCNNKIAQGGGGDGHETPMMEHGIQVKKQPAAAFVDHSGRVDPRSAAFEQRKLVQTLEKWKADLSPGRKEDGRRGAWRSLSPAACFRGSGDWGR